MFLKERILTFIITPSGDNNATSILEIKVEKTKAYMSHIWYVHLMTVMDFNGRPGARDDQNLRWTTRKSVKVVQWDYQIFLPQKQSKAKGLQVCYKGKMQRDLLPQFILHKRPAGRQQN